MKLRVDKTLFDLHQIRGMDSGQHNQPGSVQIRSIQDYVVAETMKKSVRNIINGLGSPVLVVDKDLIIEFANDAARERFGTELRGRSCAVFAPEEDWLDKAASVFKDEETARSSFVFQDVVPTEFSVHISRIDPSSKVDKTLAAVSFEDISVLREAEQMRSDFVANVSHELRSPLTAVYGFIETMQGAAQHDPAARNRFLSLMSKEAKRMARLIDELLILAQLEASGRVAPSGHVDVQDNIKSVLTVLAESMEREKKQVLVEAEPALPLVLGDADQLTQVFQNLIENAIKYSAPKSNVLVRISTATSASPGAEDQLSVAITDHGEGIAPEYLPRLTERFFRVDKGRSRQMGGTGLGLAIVKHILIRHRGRLQIESEIGKGSTFTVLLPCLKVS